MPFILCATAGFVLPFISGILVAEEKPFIAFVVMNTGAFFAISAIGMAASAT